MRLDLEACCRRYRLRWPDRPPVVQSHGWMYGIWMIGNDYRNASSLYGAYPHGLLDRLATLLGNHGSPVLHLFSGSLPKVAGYVRFDLAQPADVVGDARKLSTYFPKTKFARIYADPPYSAEDAVHYGTPMVNRNAVVKECAKVICPGGLLVWLDQVYPMYSKAVWEPVGHIGVVRSTNHRFRIISIWEKT